MDEKILILLHRSFDGPLTDSEQDALAEALAASPELRAEKEQIATMRAGIARAPADSFGPFFAERVMQKLAVETASEDNPALFFESLVYLFRRVALAGAVAVIVLVAYNWQSSDEISLASAFGANEAGVEEVLEMPIESILEPTS